MCGIAGIAGRPDVDALSRMLCDTQHRGPDDRGTFADETVAIGMNRLSILDLSGAGHQPMISNDEQVVIVYNGELYNFKEERERLRALGHVFHSATDTEVVLALYLQHGKSCLAHMRGMFAFAIWDRRSQELFAARDHLGIKPFLYTQQHAQLIFCSELKGLMAHGAIPKTLDREALAEYFVIGHINQPRTIFSRVRSLEPGHFLVWKQGQGCAIERYWTPVDARSDSKITYADAMQRTRELVTNSVAEELVSDVPLGVFLSGGIDSNVVVAAMQAAGASRIKTYSIGFGGEHDALDESADALASAKFFGTEHFTVDITSRDVEQDFENMVAGFDQPVVDGYNTYLVSKHARSGVTVALSGLGGDEVFGGYHHYRLLLRTALTPRKKYTIARLTRPVWERAGLNDQRLVKLHETAARASVAEHYSLMQPVYKPAQAAALLSDLDRPFSLTEIYRTQQRANAHLDDLSLADPFQRISLIGMRSFMAHRLLRDSDAVSMKHSLEIRVPLIDKRIVEYVFPLPWELKFKRDVVLDESATDRAYGTAGVKRLLVDAFANQLPPDITTRVKRGFMMPLTVWLDKAFGDRIRDTLEGANSPIHSPMLKQVLGTWRQKKSNTLHVWSLVVLAEWMRQMNVTSIEDAE